MDGKHLFSDSLVGVAILAVLATIGALLSNLPYANKLPMVLLHPYQVCLVKNGL